MKIVGPMLEVSRLWECMDCRLEMADRFSIGHINIIFAKYEQRGGLHIIINFIGGVGVRDRWICRAYLTVWICRFGARFLHQDQDYIRPGPWGLLQLEDAFSIRNDDQEQVSTETAAYGAASRTTPQEVAPPYYFFKYSYHIRLGRYSLLYILHANSPPRRVDPSRRMGKSKSLGNR